VPTRREANPDAIIAAERERRAQARGLAGKPTSQPARKPKAKAKPKRKRKGPQTAGEALAIAKAKEIRRKQREQNPTKAFRPSTRGKSKKTKPLTPRQTSLLEQLFDTGAKPRGK